MGDHERLPAAAGSRDGRERRAHLPAHLAADALVDLVEHERRHRVVLRQDDLQRQHEP